MRTRLDARNFILGAMLAGALILAAGAVGGDPTPAVGRFDIACTNTTCYLVDSTTGQIWISHEAGFRSPKIKAPPEKQTAAAKGYVGRWTGVDPDQAEISIHLVSDGSLVADDDDGDQYKGFWWIEGDRLKCSVAGEVYTGEISTGGQLILWEDEDPQKKIGFHRIK